MILEDKGRCNLTLQLENRRKNTIVQMLGKSTVNCLNTLDIISEDYRLREIYISVIKKYGH